MLYLGHHDNIIHEFALAWCVGEDPWSEQTSACAPWRQSGEHDEVGQEDQGGVEGLATNHRQQLCSHSTQLQPGEFASSGLH